MKSSDINIRVAHNIDREEIKRFLSEKVISKSLSSEGIEWSGYNGRLKGKGFKAMIHISERDIEVRVDLSIFLKPISKKIGEEIEGALKRGIARYSGFSGGE